MEHLRAHTIVIGAGVIGLACAARLAREGAQVLVLEAAGAIGTGISSRNSEVIHGGMYYAQGSLKHELCVRGRRLLYAYLAARGVAHHACGKLIVATDAAQIPKIEAIHAQAEANGVEGCALLPARTAMAWEPNLFCTAALHSPATGLIDSHGFMLALQGELEDFGGRVAFHTPVLGGEVGPGGPILLRTGGASPALVQAERVINCAGLGAVGLAQSLAGLPAIALAVQKLAKGNYFSCQGRAAFSRLIYPAPVDGGLGVHLTLDLTGRMRFGPDVEWLADHDPASLDYNVDAQRAQAFYAAIRRYWPALPDGALRPDYCGIRPKLSGPGQPGADFRIDGPQRHGISGLVNLFGIESPGLTASLAIAEHVSTALAAAN